MRCVAVSVLLFAFAGCSPAPLYVAPPPEALPPPYHLHLPGISGNRWIDRTLTQGLIDGGIAAEMETYDWTTADPGLGSLLAYTRNRSEAQKVAALLAARSRADPRRRITVSSHSGGAGIIIWALESLSDDVTIDTLVLLSPALSPGYDLTAALRHVKGNVYVFYSPYDVAVLGLGTKMFGTIDGLKTEAAGKVGFTRPPSADARQYDKLVQVPYDTQWVKLGNIGDHIGTMGRTFARQIVAPLMLTGRLPETKTDELAMPAATTPATAPAAGAGQ